MPTELAFAKGQGTGNDFVLVADPEGATTLTPEQVAAVCDRRFGIGADGYIRAVRTRALPEAAALADARPDAEWFMDYWNSDGSASEMCGNGIRVFVRYLLARGLVALAPGETIAVGTRAGVREVSALGDDGDPAGPVIDGFEVDLGVWRGSGDEPLVSAGRLAVPRPGLGIDVGNPHVVVALADDAELDRLDLGEAPVLDPVPSAGANVEFVVPADPLVVDGVGRIRMRVHERGSGETLSCGTGTAAAALAVRHWAGTRAPERWEVAVPGGLLGVRVVRAHDGEHVLLSGPAALVYEGRLTLE